MTVITIRLDETEADIAMRVAEEDRDTKVVVVEGIGMTVDDEVETNSSWTDHGAQLRSTLFPSARGYDPQRDGTNVQLVSKA